MNSTLRALLGMAGVYGTAVVAAFLFLRWYRPSLIDAGMTAALVALPLAAALGYLVGAPRYLQEERLLIRSIDRPAFKDGARVAAIGPVEPLAELLRSPFAARECVAYQYDIDHEHRDVEGHLVRIRDYWGMAVSPWQVRTPAGPVRILGYATIEALPEVLDDDDSYRVAEEYLRSNLFRHPASPGERLGSLAEPLTTESDSFRDDICADALHAPGSLQREVADLRKLQVRERRLEVGQTVCAVGYYSEARQALVPTTRGVKRLRISTYSPRAWAADNRHWARVYLGWGTGLLVLAVGCALATRWC